jgi:elongation factor G
MDRLRTFGIVAHIDAGKTTLTERILFDAGAQGWIGSVEDGTAAMDWMPEERARGISITAAASRVQWGQHVMQVVDTPGHIDFVAEVERCLHVLDGVVVLLDGIRGVESQTEAVWEQACGRGLPRLVFVNKLDREGADFAAVVAEAGERLGCRPVPVVVPLFDDSGAFAGLGDALGGRVQWFAGKPPAAVAERITAELLAAHDRVVEAVADRDDDVFADALAGRRIAAERLRRLVRAESLDGRLVPVLCGAALWNRGVDWLLDAVVDYLPAPVEMPRQGLWATPAAGDPAAPFCAFVFKVQHVDAVTWNFVRVIRGTLRVGDSWVRGRGGAQGACAALWVVQADRHSDVEWAGPGQIVVLPGEFALRTGDSICAPDAPLVVAAPRFPAPVLAMVFEPDRAEDRPRLAQALRDLAVDDPTLRVDVDRDRLLVRGMGELHLEIVAELAKNRSGVAFHCSRPQVDRRETIEWVGRGEAEIRAIIAGVECSATCAVEVRPAKGQGPATVLDEVGGAAAAAAVGELVLLVAAGLRVGAMHDMVVVLQRAECSTPTPNLPLMEQAASKALEQAVGGACPCDLEPWVVFEVWCPEEGAPVVIADLAARGAEVEAVAAGRLGARVGGRAPLMCMLGYVTKLRSITRGRGRVDMRPAGLRPVRGRG